MKVMMKELAERLQQIANQILGVFDTAGYTHSPRFQGRAPQFVLARPMVRPLNRRNHQRFRYF
jgi:hypothetical protein